MKKITHWFKNDEKNYSLC